VANVSLISSIRFNVLGPSSEVVSISNEEGINPLQPGRLNRDRAIINTKKTFFDFIPHLPVWNSKTA
jgi:hypothetical protein